MEMAPSGDAEPSGDLYTIPFSSSWFQWEEIHEIEKQALPEFFQGVSITKNPRVYKGYRDFIINKFRQNPSKKLKFTEIRKALIGDVTLLHKLFSFLEKHGLINFTVPVPQVVKDNELVRTQVVVEEGPPHGLYVVPVIPESSKKMTGTGQLGFNKLPHLISYSDVFGEWDPLKAPLCVFCGEQCISDKYKKLEDGLKICPKCHENKNKKELESTETPINNNTNNNNNNNNDSDTNIITNNNNTNIISTNNGDNNLQKIPSSVLWTDAETLLLLEGVLKHGEDWDLITQHVRTKNKTECVARLIQLPFGEQMLINSRTNGKLISVNNDSDDNNNNNNNNFNKVGEVVVNEIDKKDEIEKKDEMEKNEEELSPLKKKSRVCFDFNAADSLMRQVGLLSTMAGPDVATSAAEAAIVELCNESEYARDVFDFSNFEPENNKIVSSNKNPPSNLDANMEIETDLETIKQTSTGINEDFKSIVYRVRAGVATAIGAAAARSKLLADHEEREIELLMSSIIQSQLKKIQLKLKHFEELELIMEKERDLIQEQKGALIKEWLVILGQIFQDGVPRWKDSFVPNPY